MKLKNILSLAFLSVFTLSVMNTHAQDAKAKGILDKVSAKMKAAKTLKANFSMAMKDAKGATKQNISGNFLMKGSKYRVNAGAQEIICDGKSIWTYLKKNNEVQVASYNPNEQTVSPAKLFSGSYENEYTYSYKGSKSFGGKTCDLIELKPKSAKGFSRVELFVDASGNIAGGNIYDKSGSYYTYSVSGVTPNAAIADNQFSFDAKAHPGVDVVDLR